MHHRHIVRLFLFLSLHKVEKTNQKNELKHENDDYIYYVLCLFVVGDLISIFIVRDKRAE